MDDKDCIGRDCGARFIRSIGRVALFTMLSWNVYAAADRFPGAQMQLHGLVNATGEIRQSEIVNQELASLDVVDTGVSKQVQNLQSAPIVPLGTPSLEVVDTGTSRQVQKLQPAAVVSADTEASAALESEVNVSTSGEADELNSAAARVDDHQVKIYRVMLPMTDVAEKNEIAGVVAETAKKNGPLGDASGSAVSEEAIHLPYAVLLAILALISMATVSRRNG